MIKQKKSHLNLANLKQCREEFQIKLENKFQILHDEVEQEDVNDICDKFSKTIQDCATDVAGKQDPQKSDKISKETLDLLKKRRELKVTTQNEGIEYTELCKTIRKRMKN